MKNKKKKRKGFNASAMRCPYCGASVVYRSADGIYQNNDKGAMLYVCSHYPACDAYVRVHAGTKRRLEVWQTESCVLCGEQHISISTRCISVA